MMADKRKYRVLAVPDMHLPWVDWKAVDKIYELIEKEKPHVVIQLGDLQDFFAYSRFARSLDVCTPKEEVQEGRAGAVNFWKTVRKLLPRTARCVQLSGNHDRRLLARALEKFPEILSIVRVQDLFSFPQVETFQDAADFFELDGVVYTHGYLTRLGDHAKHFQANVVHGHTHRGGVIFFNTRKGPIWELDCGFIADQTAIPLQYGATKHNHWIKGCGLIDDYGPRFIPL